MGKGLIIYISIHHHNTEKVANVIARVLDADLFKPNEVSQDIIPRYGLIGFGSGIYYGKHHRNLLSFVENLSKMDGRKAFIFSTSGLRRIPLFHDFNKPLEEKLRKKGFMVIGNFSCRGFTTHGPFKLLGGINKGHPNENDLAKAEAFAKKLKEAFRNC